MHRPTGFHLLSSQVRQCCVQSTDVVSHVVHADDGDADDEVGGVQCYSYDDYGDGVGVGFTISHTAVTCWACSPSPVLQSNSRVQQKLGVVALPYTLMFMLLLLLLVLVLSLVLPYLIQQ